MNHSSHDDLAHLRVWELLPWVANGTATAHERALVSEHMRDCDACRTELVYQKRLHAVMNAQADAIGPDIEAGLANLSRRIDRRQAAPRSRVAMLCYGLAALLAIETGGIAVFGALRGDRPVTYRTLSQSDGTPTHATIRLVVDPAMPVGRLQALLVPLGLQIMGGPGENGVYSVGAASHTASQAAGNAGVNRQIEMLRAATGVRFVEPVASVGDGT